ncbi:hypothetical protein [Paracoccus tibetensis]|uniref:Concanavalin A-like lectin/glucanases superfamily protein n=1 Tax=Paracoccus tibetensis TaxID=336292 RepID=A0A1G5HCC6_9RHOB|nr:hypothetical protein [Paracoccus tibetensis]SCY61331.1 hypothetical protein SAMN05660710_02098 [Paracoccus tibetensis]
MTATVIASRGIITNPTALTPNIYDRGEAVILDAARIQDVADGARVPAVLARGSGPVAARTFDTRAASNGNLPMLRRTGGPGGLPCLELDGTASIKNGAAVSFDGGFYIAAMIKMDEWAAQTVQRFIARVDGSAGMSIALSLIGSTPSVRIFGGTLSDNVTLSLASPLTTWQPLIVSWGSDNRARIVFGDAFVEGALARPVASNLQIGSTPNGDLSGGAGLKAKIAELRHGAGSLTLAQARALAALLAEKYNL